MPRGGKREGKPGKSYGNRTDMNQPVQTGPSQGYGQRVALERQQQAVPLPAARPVATPGSAVEMSGPPTPPPDLLAPTDRPNEPITAGLPMGPGPGPEALGMELSPVDKLKRIYRATMNPDILELIALAEDA